MAKCMGAFPYRKDLPCGNMRLDGKGLCAESTFRAEETYRAGNLPYGKMSPYGYWSSRILLDRTVILRTATLID
jgi:hypothetical protein